jgi:hypothetical protein
MSDKGYRSTPSAPVSTLKTRERGAFGNLSVDFIARCRRSLESAASPITPLMNWNPQVKKQLRSDRRQHWIIRRRCNRLPSR